MCHANNEKPKTKNDGRKKSKNQEKIRNLGEKETYKYLEMLKVDTIKKADMKKK